MKKKMLALAFLLLAFMGIARAEVYVGVTAEISEIPVCADADGLLAAVFKTVGSEVEAGELLAEYQTDRVFAAQDGTVAIVHASEGERVSGMALEIMPAEKYKIYCSAKNAYPSPECMLVHNGERVYVQCTVNGTHRGIGVIAGVDGQEYSVLTVGGEFLVGETVYLYRDEAFSIKQRVGIGTVVQNETEKYAAEGTIIGMFVRAGEEVERGQLMYETVSGAETGVRSGVSGIIKSVAAAGETVRNGQVVATVVPREKIGVEILVSERAAADFEVDSRVSMTYSADRSETVRYGTVIAVSDTEDPGVYRVQIAPDETDGLMLGMTANVWRIG